MMPEILVIFPRQEQGQIRALFVHPPSHCIIFTHPCVWTLRCFTDYLHNKVPFRLEKK